METFLPLKTQGRETNKKEYRERTQNNKNNAGTPKKRGRLIVRNLPYKVEEEDILKLFKPFGEITEVKFLTFEDGRKKGVAFVEYINVLSALKAIKECNMKKLLGRPIAVDLAVSKEKYTAANPKAEIKQESEIKKENEDGYDTSSNGIIPLDQIKIEKDDSAVKVESMDTESAENVKEEDTSENEDDSDIEECDSDDEEVEDDDEFDDEDDDEMDDVNMKDVKVKKEREESNVTHKSVSKDVVEGRSLFIRGLSFDAVEEDVSELLSHFGKLKYVLFCKDKITQRFRGTAFAQFLDKVSSDRCLEAFSDPAYKDTFRLGGRYFTISPAIGREEITHKSEMKKEKKEPEDKRNLYLAREGVIREGTQAAIGVSKTDLALRVIREKIKRKMLVNFNIFMSPNRLFICNLPLELTDKELKDVVKKHSPKGTVIKECRIMKDVLNCDVQGNPVSKGHAFVALTEHSHALEALRTINNNPEIFTRAKRPIVEFSMENKAALKAKEMRIQKSKDGNKKKELEKAQKLREKVFIHSTSKADQPQFMGSNYDPKKKGRKAFHTHIGPKIRHRDSAKKSGKITRNQVNNQLRKSSMMKRNNQRIKNKSNPKNKSQNQKNKSKNQNKNSKNPKSKTKKKKFL